MSQAEPEFAEACGVIVDVFYCVFYCVWTFEPEFALIGSICESGPQPEGHAALPESFPKVWLATKPP